MKQETFVLQDEIYQTNQSKSITRQIRFTEWKYIKAHSDIRMENYKLIYQDTLSKELNFSKNSILEHIFVKFNIMLPDDFYGHSLSVSDVIVLRIDDRKIAYYVDSVGFVEIPNFFA